MALLFQPELRLAQLAFSPEDELLARVVALDGTVRVWDTTVSGLRFGPQTPAIHSMKSKQLHHLAQAYVVNGLGIWFYRMPWRRA